jgi:hypothetical protein
MPRRCFENSLYEKHSGGARATQLRQTHNGDVGQELSEALPVKQSRFHEAFIAFAPASRTTAVASQECDPAVKTKVVLAVTMRILAGASYLDVGWPYGLADSTMCNLAAFTCTRVQPGHKHELLRCASFFRNPGGNERFPPKFGNGNKNGNPADASDWLAALKSTFPISNFQN